MRPIALSLTLLALLLTGCRLHIDHTKDGVPLSPEKMEIPAYAMFVNAKSGAPAPTRAPQAPGARVLPGMMFTSKPLTLNGDARGHEQLRAFFDRETLVLERVEVAYGRPGGGVSSVAQGTFLK